MAGGYLMPDGTLTQDIGQETSPAITPVDSPCGKAAATLTEASIGTPIEAVDAKKEP